jgi:DNA modification methylase
MTDSQQRRIEYMSVTEMMERRHPANPKDHDLGLIAQSFLVHGFGSSGMIDDRTNYFLCGHGRAETLDKMKREKMDVPRYVEARNGDWYAPVERGYESLNDEQALAYIVMDNKATIAGGWDEVVLTGLLQELANSDEIELTASGFDGDELDQILQDLNGDYNEQEPPETQMDKAAELNKKWKVESGQLWQIGGHKLLCGDSTNSAHVNFLMGGVKVVLCHADPPYGMGKEKDGVINDNLYREKLDTFQMAWWRACRVYLEDNASCYIWGNAEDLWRLWYCGGLRDSERLTLRNEIVWAQEGSSWGKSGMSDLRMYAQNGERCLFFMLGEQQMSTNADNYWDGWESIRVYLKEQRDLMGWDIVTCKRLAGHSETSGCHWFDKSQWTMPTKEVYESWQRAAKSDAFKREYDDIKREYDDIKREWLLARAYFDNTHDNMTDVWQFPRVQGGERWHHSTPKPIEVIQRIIKSSSNINDLVYEPFLGSGTTMVAAEQLNRKCYGLEISPDYCAVILERMTAMGLEAELIDNYQTD